jgi:hypothetical protein
VFFRRLRLPARGARAQAHAQRQDLRVLFVHPDRPAYGCYPEVRGQKAIGHSFEFLSALARRGRFSAAHADILVSDETPDIPLRSSDVYLAEQIAKAAGHPSARPPFADPLVQRPSPATTSTRRAAWSTESRPSMPLPGRPRSPISTSVRTPCLTFLDQLDLDAKTWEGALGDFNQANLDGFLASQPRWRNRLGERAVRGLDTAARRSSRTNCWPSLRPT